MTPCVVLSNLFCVYEFTLLCQRDVRHIDFTECEVQVMFFEQKQFQSRPCHGSGGRSPASHSGGPASIPVQSMWGLWWTKWHWDRFFYEYFGFPPVNFIPPVLHYLEKRGKLIIFMTGLHNKPQGCGTSVASAAGPFTTKKFLSRFWILQWKRRN
jgi:hypothetical protein